MTDDPLRDIQMPAFFIWERNGWPEGLALTGSFAVRP
jgi:hypothetical protein